MSATWSTFLLEAVNFILLAGVLGWLLFKPIRESLKTRQEDVRRQREEIEQNLAKANEAKTESETLRRNLDEELQGLREARITAAEQEASEILKKARETADRERGLLKQQLAQIESSQMEQLASAIAVATGETVGRLLDQMEGPDLETVLVRAACRELESLELNGSGPTVVESARRLAPESRSALERALRNSGVEAKYDLNEDLGAGLRITTPRGVVDASSQGLARYAARALRENLKPRLSQVDRDETSASESSP